MRTPTARSNANGFATVADTGSALDLEAYGYPLEGVLPQIAALQINPMPGNSGDRYRVEVVLATGETVPLAGETGEALETVVARCDRLSRTLGVPVVEAWDEDTEDQFDAMLQLLIADPDQRQEMIATCEQQIQAGEGEAETYCLLALAWLAVNDLTKARLALVQGRSHCLGLGLADGVMDIDRLGQRYGLVGA